MTNISENELRSAVEAVLSQSARGKGGAVSWMTAYQILSSLPKEMQRWLEDQYGPGRGGSGMGKHFSPATRVAQIAAKLNVDIEYLDTRKLAFDLGNEEDAAAGNKLCALFRLKSA